jgi:hypothetical protein
MSTLRELFADPSVTYRVQPLWFLNHELTDAQLRRQIREMHAQGVGGVVLQARPGLRTPWMSERWFAALSVCVDELKSLGMYAWLSDASIGAASACVDRMVGGHPEYRARHLRVQSLRVNGGVTYQVRLPDHGSSLVCIQAVRISAQSAEEGGCLEFVDEPRDLTEHYQEGRLRWEAPTGYWFVAVFWECPTGETTGSGDACHLDVMDREAVSAYLQHAYKPYERFQTDFGGTIKGMLTGGLPVMPHDAACDAVAINADGRQPLRKLPGVSLPWTRDMLSKFRELKGYDLRPRLMQLLWDIGPDTQQVRSDYYSVISTLYCDAYHGQLADWCREHGLEYVGGTTDDALWHRICTQGDQMAVQACFDRPGFGHQDHAPVPERIVAARLATSASHLGDAKRVACTVSSGSGHGATLAELRTSLNFTCALGCSTIMPHAFHYSMAGCRKTDSPPTGFYHNSYWPWYSHFADYTARQCLVQATGGHVCDTLVLLPTETAQVDTWHEGELCAEPPCRRLLTWLSDELLRLQCDYDYVSDSRLQAAVVRDGRLTFPDSEVAYSLLILPGCRVMSIHAARKLLEWRRAGGCLVILGEPPGQALGRGQDEQLQDLIAELVASPTEDTCSQSEQTDGIIDAAPQSGQDAELHPGEGPQPDEMPSPDEGAASDEGMPSDQDEAVYSDEDAAEVSGSVEDLESATGVEADSDRMASAHDYHSHEKSGMSADSLRPGQVVCHPTEDVEPEWLRSVLSSLLEPSFTLDADEPAERRDIICSRRRHDSLELFMMHNRSDRRQAAIATAALAGALEEWDLETGSTATADAEYATDHTRWYVDLEPHETRLFVLDCSARGETARVEGTVGPQVLDEIDLGACWGFNSGGQNVVILDRWQLVLDDRVARGKVNLRGFGQANSYVTSFEIEGQIGLLQLMLDDLWRHQPGGTGAADGMRTVEIFVNGQSTPPLTPSDWQDPYFAATDISALVHPGTNELQICTVSTVDSMASLSHPAWLVGEFANLGGRLTAEPDAIEGYFSQNGYPHLAGIGTYSKRIDVPQALLDGKRRVILDVGQVRDCARALVNGQEVAIRLWAPFEVDITEELRPGENHIAIEVAGTLANLYDKATHPAGLPGPAKLWVIG